MREVLTPRCVSVSSKLAPAIPASLQHPTFSFVEHGLSDLRAEECFILDCTGTDEAGPEQAPTALAPAGTSACECVAPFLCASHERADLIKRCGWPLPETGRSLFSRPRRSGRRAKLCSSEPAVPGVASCAAVCAASCAARSAVQSESGVDRAEFRDQRKLCFLRWVPPNFRRSVLGCTKADLCKHTHCSAYRNVD